LEELPKEEAASLFAGDIREFDLPTDYPLSYAEIQEKQQTDRYLRRRRLEPDSPYNYTTFKFAGRDFKLVAKEDKIVLPKALQHKAVQYYHAILCHPGQTHTELTMAQHYTWVGMRNTVRQVCERCGSCQLHKAKKQHFGHLPPKKAEEGPWETLCIDLIGPYLIRGLNQQQRDPDLTLHCLTMIDPVTGWFEIAKIPAKRADVIMNVLEFVWLSRYPRPTTVVMDNGREFYAEVEQSLKNDYGITRRVITTQNPQANSILERAHKTLHDMLSTQHIGEGTDSRDRWDGILSAVGFAMKATVHSTMKATPMQLVFGRDAIHNVRFIADWQWITEQRQRVINQNNKRENAKHVPHEYHAGDRVSNDLTISK
jgi:Integrase zinc binding domain